MSEFNEELLNDVDDYPDIGDADEDALLQDDEDGDVLDLVPEEEDIGESLEDSRTNPTEEEEKEERGDKFAVERQRITAPEPTVEEHNTPRPNNRFQRPNNRGNQRGRGGGINGRGRFQNNGRGKFGYTNQSGRNKTVLINPRFQGVVHVNNNARLAWDTPQQQQQQQYQPNPWVTGTPPGHMGRTIQPFQGGQSIQGPPIQAGPPMQPQHMQSFPVYQHLHYIPPQTEPPFMPQPLPPGVQQGPMQGQTQPGNPFMQGNYQSSPPIIINTGHPPPPTPSYQQYNPQGNSPMLQQNFNPNQNFPPQNQPVFPNNNMNNARFNQGNSAGPNKRELFTQKRKVMQPGNPQNKKVFVRERLGPTPQSQVRIKTEERPSVVREVTVTNVTTVKIEEDEQTRDLRLKIEEQKRKREAILQWKEKRRLENLGKSPIKESPNLDQKVITQIQVVEQNLVKVEQKVEQKLPQRTPNQRQNFQRTKQHVQPVRQAVQSAQVQNWPAKMKKQSNNIVITNGFSRKYTRYQKNTKFPNVVVTVPITPPVVPEPKLNVDKEPISSTFLADRKVLAKDESLMPTRKVLIKNISTSTGDKKLFQISKNIGVVQKLHREKNERQATITFKNVASAHAFFKKYQRYMLDLSMIEVSLIPMTESDE